MKKHIITTFAFIFAGSAVASSRRTPVPATAKPVQTNVQTKAPAATKPGFSWSRVLGL